MRKLLVMMAGLLLGYVLVLVGMRFVPPDAAQRAALATLREPTPPVAGRDGSDASWLLGYRVPKARRAAVAADFRRWADARDPWNASNNTTPDPRDAFAKQAKAPEKSLCETGKAGCLAYVRNNEVEVASMLATNQPLLEANLELSTQFDGVRFGLKPRTWEFLPLYGRALSLEQTYFAHEFVQGRRVEALGGLCAHLAGARRLNSDTDYLIGNMISIGAARRDVVLISEMLAEWPAGEALPAGCAEAIAPMADAEFNLCPAMRSEFAGQEFALSNLGQWMAQEGQGPWKSWMVDREKLLAMTAENEVELCARDKVLAAAAADRAYADFLTPPKACPWWRTATDPGGCLLWEMSASGSLSRYQDRLTDLSAIFALLRTSLRLRELGATTANAQQLLDARPTGMKRSARFDAATGEISIRLLGGPDDELRLAFLPIATTTAATTPVP
jgi:hypothetical protein